MSSFKAKFVLLVDHRKDRVREVAATLKKTWAAETKVVMSFEEASQIAQSRDTRFDVVIVALGIGDYRHLLRELCPKSETTRLLMTDDDRSSYPENAPKGFRLIVSPIIARNDTRLVERLEQYMEPRPPRLPVLDEKNWPGTLSNQVRWLNPDGILSKGKELIQHLVWQLDPTIRKFQLIQLGQGFSGSSVFRLGKIEREPKKSASPDLVLKLTRQDPHQEYKCQHELKFHDQIKDSLNKWPLEHVPNLIATSGGEPAECDRWLAVMYFCVSHKDLCVADLERVVIEPERCHAEAQKKSKAMQPVAANQLSEHVLKNLFGLLEQWYAGAKSPQVRVNPLWATDHAPSNKPPAFPSYRFTSWEKKDILEAICGLDHYGQSLPAADWETSRQQVLRLIGADEAAKLPEALTVPRPLLLSRVHGDLNANNVLFELQSGLVLFIDFACFQQQGHLVQDFARLEVALKIELMGREVDGPAGRDLNTTEFGYWCDAEKWLQSWPDESAADLGSTGISLSSRRMFELCALIRRSAEGIHSRLAKKCKGEKPDFQLSYEAALLYHTVRSIRFASRPHLKRIFSVYSARLLADRLDSVGRARKKR